MTGSELIANERNRQVQQERWSPEHDAEHGYFELSMAAVCYALHAAGESEPDSPPSRWPWGSEWWKPSEDPIRDLVKAGALIAAEIDRLQGLTPQVSVCIRNYRHTGPCNGLPRADCPSREQMNGCRWCDIGNPVNKLGNHIINRRGSGLGDAAIPCFRGNSNA